MNRLFHSLYRFIFCWVSPVQSSFNRWWWRSQRSRGWRRGGHGVGITFDYFVLISSIHRCTVDIYFHHFLLTLSGWAWSWAGCLDVPQMNTHCFYKFLSHWMMSMCIANNRHLVWARCRSSKWWGWWWDGHWSDRTHYCWHPGWET